MVADQGPESALHRDNAETGSGQLLKPAEYSQDPCSLADDGQPFHNPVREAWATIRPASTRCAEINGCRLELFPQEFGLAESRGICSGLPRDGLQSRGDVILPERSAVVAIDWSIPLKIQR